MIWPFPLLRNHSTDRVVTELFLAFARTDFKIVRNGVYELHLSSPMGEIKCWNANRWYCWADRGTFTPADPAESSITWDGRMPSRWAVRQMRSALERAEIARFRAAERGDIALDLSPENIQPGYVVRKAPAGVRVPAEGRDAT